MLKIFVLKKLSLAEYCQEAPAGDDDDDLDLFGDETEEEKKAAEQREAAKAPAKKKESKVLWTICLNDLLA